MHNRFDTTVPSQEYQVKQARTLASINHCTETETLGVLHKPLIQIEVKQVL